MCIQVYFQILVRFCQDFTRWDEKRKDGGRYSRQQNSKKLECRNVETIKWFTWFWHFDCVDIFAADCTFSEKKTPNIIKLFELHTYHCKL